MSLRLSIHHSAENNDKPTYWTPYKSPEVDTNTHRLQHSVLSHKLRQASPSVDRFQNWISTTGMDYFLRWQGLFFCICLNVYKRSSRINGVGYNWTVFVFDRSLQEGMTYPPDSDSHASIPNTYRLGSLVGPWVQSCGCLIHKVLEGTLLIIS